jgi:hypothetical protein
VDVDVADEEEADGEAGFVLPALETKLATGGPGKVYGTEGSNTWGLKIYSVTRSQKGARMVGPYLRIKDPGSLSLYAPGRLTSSLSAGPPARVWFPPTRNCVQEG